MISTVMHWQKTKKNKMMIMALQKTRCNNYAIFWRHATFIGLSRRASSASLGKWQKIPHKTNLSIAAPPSKRARDDAQEITPAHTTTWMDHHLEELLAQKNDEPTSNARMWKTSANISPRLWNKTLI
jgi:hypothetical protein